MKPTLSEKLKTTVESALADLTQVESRFKDVVATADLAKVLTNATKWLAATREVEATRQQLLESASEVERGLEAFKAAVDEQYRNAMMDATVRSRQLHSQRVALEEQISAINAEILLADQEEAPAVAKALERNQFANDFANYASAIKTEAVRLVHSTPAVAA